MCKSLVFKQPTRYPTIKVTLTIYFSNILANHGKRGRSWAQKILYFLLALIHLEFAMRPVIQTWSLVSHHISSYK